MPANPPLPMQDDRLDIKAVRDELGLSQAELADMAGVSVRAVQSCEQGWRRPSPALEKTIILLLMAHRYGSTLPEVKCWEVMDCVPERCENCISRRTAQGHLCWFLHGTLCAEPRHQDWESKRGQCLSCAFLKQLLKPTAE